MSEFLIVFTLVVTSPDKLILTAERVNLAHKSSEEVQQFTFANTEAGFAAAEKQQKTLRDKSHDAAADCMVIRNPEKKGFINAGMRHFDNLPEASQKPGATVAELAALCRRKKAGF